MFYQLSKDFFQISSDMMAIVNANAHFPTIWVLPITPMYAMDGVFNEVLGITRYIGGLDGEVVLCKTILGMIFYK